MSSCVFNSPSASMIHDVVKGTASTTSLFNSFFARMHDAFGYTLKQGDEKEEWWNMSLPAYNISSTHGARDGGYVK